MRGRVDDQSKVDDEWHNKRNDAGNRLGLMKVHFQVIHVVEECFIKFLTVIKNM